MCRLLKHEKPIIGLIGSIGAGKSAVAELLQKRNARVIDADRLGHLALEQEAVKASIVRRWGFGMIQPNGSINRKALAGIVFHDESERKGLESIIHPAIQKMVKNKVAEGIQDQTVRFIVLDAAVLLEAGWKDEVDLLIFVDADREARLKRVAERSGWTESELTAREMAQMPIAEKRLQADVQIDNNGTLDELQIKVDRILQQWGLWETNAKEETCRLK